MEERYPPIKKLALAVIAVTRRLHPYFHVHMITLPTGHPVLQVLKKPYVLGRLTKWVIELSEFDIKVVLARAIKEQVLVDFLVELTPKKKKAGKETWIMHID